MRGNGENTAVLLDRHPLWLDALEGLLEKAGVKVVGKSTSPVEALSLVEEIRPTVLVTEYDSLEQSEDGLATLRQLSAHDPNVHVVVLGTYDDAAHIDAAFAAGASVYCVKTAQPEDLASAIRQAFHGPVYFAGNRSRASEQVPVPTHVDDSPGLTRREVEILQLVAEGYSNSQLAKMLWVTEQTVKFHLSNIYRKLDVANRTEASRWAQLHGLLPDAREASAAAA
jgi:DNA-binding NarL/FixJ family response regulator